MQIKGRRYSTYETLSGWLFGNYSSMNTLNNTAFIELHKNQIVVLVNNLVTVVA